MTCTGKNTINKSQKVPVPDQHLKLHLSDHQFYLSRWGDGRRVKLIMVLKPTSRVSPDDIAAPVWPFQKWILNHNKRHPWSGPQVKTQPTYFFFYQLTCRLHTNVMNKSHWILKEAPSIHEWVLCSTCQTPACPGPRHWNMSTIYQPKV